jgi:cytochrome c oxidase subunit II
MSASSAPAPRVERTDRQHVRRIGLIWLVACVVAMPLVYFVLGPHLPPGNDSVQAASQQEDNAVLAVIATPVLLFIWIYFGYAVKNWRIPADTPLEEIQDGPPIRGNRRFQVTWITVTSLTVLGLFVFATVEMADQSGAGTGSGSSPIWTPAGFSSDLKDNKLLQVQVIGQQWRWTYRFPQYGGVETSELVLPAGQQVQFNVTSLDVIHSFWAVNLGVKADANPGVNNIAFVETKAIGPVDIRCAELCGTYHGAMAQTGQVMTHQDFDTWIAAQLALHKDLIPQLPPYDDFYIPQTDGGYYDPGQDPPPPVDSGLPPAPDSGSASDAPSPSPSSS